MKKLASPDFQLACAQRVRFSAIRRYLEQPPVRLPVTEQGARSCELRAALDRLLANHDRTSNLWTIGRAGGPSLFFKYGGSPNDWRPRAGGMGEVYRASDVELNRNVVIKGVPERFVGDLEQAITLQSRSAVVRVIDACQQNRISLEPEGQMSKSNREPFSRRLFLSSAAVGGATLAGVSGLPEFGPNAQNRPSSLQQQTVAPTQNGPVSDGRSLLPPIDGATFNRIVRSANRISRATMGGTEAPVPFPTEFLPIDTDIHTDPDFGLDTIANAAAQFRFWQLESLLDQAADLLDRCARERSEYDQLRAQWAKLYLEVTEFEQLQAIHDDEIRAGWYTIVHDESQQDLAALQELVQPAGGSTAWPNPGDNQGHKAAKALAQAAFAALRTDNLLGRLHDEGDHNHTLATIDQQRVAAEVGFKIQQYDLAAQAASTDALIVGRKAKEDFDNRDIDFRRRRSGTAVLMNELKKKQMSDPGGPYNYIEQGKPIRKRFMRDFRDAYLRLLAANDGLKKILDLSVATPDFPLVTLQTGGSGIFDRALLWNREAIRMLIALGHSDQAYVLSLSLKTHLGQTTWNSRVAAGGSASKISFSFDFPADRLQGQRLTRLRGLSAFVVKNSGSKGVWHLTLRPPKSAIGPGGPSSDPLLQNVPAVHLGSVDTRNSQQPVETVGTVVLRNVSVLGHPSAAPEDRFWKLEADQTSTMGDRFQQAVADIEVEFQIVMQAT